MTDWCSGTRAVKGGYFEARRIAFTNAYTTMQQQSKRASGTKEK